MIDIFFRYQRHYLQSEQGKIEAVWRSGPDRAYLRHTWAPRRRRAGTDTACVLDSLVATSLSPIFMVAVDSWAPETAFHVVPGQSWDWDLLDGASILATAGFHWIIYPPCRCRSCGSCGL